MPLYNEAASIGRLLDELGKQPHRTLVVDDGSRDGGADIARAKAAAVLSHGENRGKGAALRKGFEHLLRQTGWDVVVLMDSDGQHDTAEIEKFLRAHKEGDADVVIGNRMAERRNMPWVRWVTNRVTSHWVSALAGQEIQDSQCGFRSLSRRVLEDLSLTCERFDLESEMLIQAGAKGYKIQSVPIRTIYEYHPSRIRPVVDSWRFFRLLGKYGFASIRTKALDPARN